MCCSRKDRYNSMIRHGSGVIRYLGRVIPVILYLEFAGVSI